MRFITPAIERAGWDLQRQIRRTVSFTDGRVIVRGKLVARGKRKRADYLLDWKKNLPLARSLRPRTTNTGSVTRCSRLLPSLRLAR